MCHNIETTLSRGNLKTNSAGKLITLNAQDTIYKDTCTKARLIFPASLMSYKGISSMIKKVSCKRITLDISSISHSNVITNIFIKTRNNKGYKVANNPGMDSADIYLGYFMRYYNFTYFSILFYHAHFQFINNQQEKKKDRGEKRNRFIRLLPTLLIKIVCFCEASPIFIFGIFSTSTLFA